MVKKSYIFGFSGYAKMLESKLLLHKFSLHGFWVEPTFSPIGSAGTTVFTKHADLRGALVYNGTVFQGKKGPQFLKRIDQIIVSNEAQWGTFNLSPQTWAISLKEGSQLFDGVYYDLNCSIGRCSQVRPGSFLGHDVVVNDFCYLSPSVRIGSNVCISASTFIGFGVVILPGVQIGSNVLVSAGSIVSRHIPDNCAVRNDGKIVKMENPFRLL